MITKGVKQAWGVIMKKLPCVLLIPTLGLVLLALIGPWPAAAQGSPFQSLFPRLATMPAPSWLRPGMRLSFYASAASLPGSRHYYWRDPQGNYVLKGDPQGDKFKRGDNPAPAGHGYLQLDVVARQGGLAVVSMLHWTMDAAGRNITPLAVQSFVCPVGDGNTFWLSPAVLRQIRPRRTPGLVIQPGPFRLKTGGSRPAAYFTTTSRQTRQTWIFDRQIGVLLSSTVSASSRENIRIGATRPSPGRLSTRRALAQTTYLGMRGRRFPWQNDPPPAWLSTVKELLYRGSSQTGVVGSPPMSRPLDFQARVVKRGPGWIHYQAVASSAGYGPMPPSRNITMQVSGTAQVGGLWLPPAGIARLRPGMLLDSDPTTGVKQWVLSLGPAGGAGRTLVIREQGQTHTTDYGYDVNRGVLVFFKNTIRNGLGFTGLDLRLVSMR